MGRERKRERETDRARERERERKMERERRKKEREFVWSSSITRLYLRPDPRLTSDNSRCCHTRDRAGRRLSQPVTLY